MLSLATQSATVFEVWTPNQDGSALEHCGGSYGEFEGLRLLSEETRFAWGSGLPGMVLASQAPVVLNRVRTANFVRAESARAAGLTAGIGLPVVAGDVVRSVLTILTSRESTNFVCEIWRGDDARSELRLRDGFYGKYCGFQSISAITRFSYGQGLPGKVWNSGMPHVIENLGASPEFLRASDARQGGLYTGIGFPVATGNGMQVVLLLSSKQAPLFKACEIWKPSDHGGTLELVEAAYGDLHDLRPSAAGIPLAPSKGIAGRVWASRSALVVNDLAKVEPLRTHQAIDAGVTTAIGYPIHRDDKVCAVVVLFC